MKDKFENALLESGELMRRGTLTIANNAGRIVAAITVIISALVLFTDIEFADLGTESFTSTLVVMLLASYFMYFSMTDAGESVGAQSEEYKSALKKCVGLSEFISGDMISGLRQFCKKYSEDELNYRRENLIMKYGFGVDEYNAYKNGISYDKRAARIFRRAERLRAISLTPKMLLSHENTRGKSELSNPERLRFMSMSFRLLPSLICMTVTVSVILTTKENLGTQIILDGIFKLFSLILIGLKGYVSGYDYKRRRVSLWLETKARLLDAFIKESKNENFAD